MGVIINAGGGGAGGGIRYNAQTDMIQVKVNGQWVDTPYKAYGTFDGTIYNAGVQAVELDNTGYVPLTGGINMGGATLSSDHFSFYADDMGSSSTGKCICTNEQLNLTDWHYLNFTYNGTDYSLDITGVTGNYYIVCYCYKAAPGSYYVALRYSESKVNYLDYGQGVSAVVGQAASYCGYPITKVWLSV